MKIKVINSSSNDLPEYVSDGSAGMDLRANLSEEINIHPGQRKLISTGLKLALPKGFEAQVRPRSGLALKHGITVLNAPGTIDSDYRGDIGVILINHGDKIFCVKSGDRIAQLLIAKYDHVEWQKSETLDDTQRGQGGFGHSGKK
jgi:dUTP pyrophosphatase